MRVVVAGTLRGTTQLMATEELTGATPVRLANMRVEHRDSPLYKNHNIPFDVAYCLTTIPKQPEDYDGGDRYCIQRAKKIEDFEGDPKTVEAYCSSCRFHGGRNGGESPEDNLQDPRVANMRHGLYADDEHLRMDFNDPEQTLYDGIVEQWPDIYDWPAEDEDPARYLILRKVATNVVRSERAEDYIDDEGEVRITDVFNEEGHVIEPDGEHEENPLAREYRLLISEILNMLRELGLTPKARQQMDTMESSESRNDALADIANEALEGEHDYNPEEFGDDPDGPEL